MYKIVVNIAKSIAELGKGIGKSIGNLVVEIFRGIAKGIKFLADPKVFVGIGAIALLGVALLPFVGAMRLMTGLNWKSLAVAAAGLVVFTAAAFGLGALMMTGAGAAIFLAGAAAIAVLGLALIPFAAAAWIASKAMVNLGAGFTSIVSGLVALQGLSFISTITSIGLLTAAITALSDAVSAIPDVKFDKLNDLNVGYNVNPQPALATAATKGATIQDLVDVITLLRGDLNTGKVVASVSIDSQKIDAFGTRAREFRGPLV